MKTHQKKLHATGKMSEMEELTFNRPNGREGSREEKKTSELHLMRDLWFGLLADN